VCLRKRNLRPHGRGKQIKKFPRPGRRDQPPRKQTKKKQFYYYYYFILFYFSRIRRDATNVRVDGK
jgi:hypothetical protein